MNGLVSTVRHQMLYRKFLYNQVHKLGYVAAIEKETGFGAVKVSNGKGHWMGYGLVGHMKKFQQKPLKPRRNTGLKTPNPEGFWITPKIRQDRLVTVSCYSGSPVAK